MVKSKTSDKNYMDFYEAEKRRYGEDLQRYEEDDMDEVEIISLHKRCNKTGGKTKASRSGYQFFLREQLGKVTGEERKNYGSIVSGR